MKIKISDEFEMEVTAEEFKTVIGEVKEIAGIVKNANISELKSIVSTAIDAGYEISEKLFRKDQELSEFKDKLDPAGHHHFVPSSSCDECEQFDAIEAIKNLNNSINDLRDEINDIKSNK